MRNVVLDWSGTLVDDLHVVVAATNAVLKEYQAPELTLQQFQAEFVLPLPKFYTRILPGIPLRDIDDCYHKHFAPYRQSVSLLPGAREFLEHCTEAGLQLFVLSTMRPEHFEAQADRLGIRQYFAKTYVGVTDKTETILSLLKENGLDPAETLLVGDMIHDLEAARRGGVMGIAVRTGFDPMEKLARSDPDAVVRDLIALRQLIAMNEIHASEEWIEIADTEEERATFQRLLVSLRLQILNSFEELKDEFASTIDYGAVAAEARRIAQNSELHLVETLASEIANGLVNRFPIRTLVVELRKFVLPDARYVSVKTTRRR